MPNSEETSVAVHAIIPFMGLLLFYLFRELREHRRIIEIILERCLPDDDEPPTPKQDA